MGKRGLIVGRTVTLGNITDFDGKTVLITSEATLETFEINVTFKVFVCVEELFVERKSEGDNKESEAV